MDFKLIFVDPKEHLIEAWRQRFSVYPQVSYHHGKFQEIEKYDCIINAGNGFGLMDGGVDYAISEYFGWGLQDRVQAYIRTKYHGEQPVGTSFLIPAATQDPLTDGPWPYLAHTPTMRAPTIIRDTDNVYSAFRAALLAIRAHNHSSPLKVSSAVCMGLGTSCGGMEPEEAARQMHLAYKHMMDPPQIDWQTAKRKHRAISTTHKGTCLDYMASSSKG